MTDHVRNRSGRHDALVETLMAIPIETLRDMLADPDELDRRLHAEVDDYSFGDFVVALKEVANRQQHEAEDLLLAADRLAAERGGR